MSKNLLGLPVLLVWVPFLIVNNKSEFQVNIFSNEKDILKNVKAFCMPTTGL